MDGAVFLKRLGAKAPPPGTCSPFLQKEELQAPVSRRGPQLFTFPRLSSSGRPQSSHPNQCPVPDPAGGLLNKASLPHRPLPPFPHPQPLFSSPSTLLGLAQGP